MGLLFSGNRIMKTDSTITTSTGEEVGNIIDFSHTKIWLESKPEQKNMVINGNSNLFSVHNENYILLKGNCIFEEL